MEMENEELQDLLKEDRGMDPATALPKRAGENWLPATAGCRGPSATILAQANQLFEIDILDSQGRTRGQALWKTVKAEPATKEGRLLRATYLGASFPEMDTWIAKRASLREKPTIHLCRKPSGTCGQAQEPGESLIHAARFRLRILTNFRCICIGVI